MIYNYSTAARCRINTSTLKEIINSIDEGNNICDKDIILGLYYSLYTIIISPISLINENLALEYSMYFNKTMSTVIRLSKARKDMVSAQSFIGNFLYYLSNNDFPNDSPILNMINLFKNDLNYFIDIERNLSNNFLLVDRDFTLEERLAISIQYKNYISDFYITITSIYGVIDTKDMLEDLKNTLDLSFPEILSISSDMARFDGEIRRYTKDRLVEIANFNEFNFYGENCHFAYDLIQMLNEDEIKVFKLYYLYKLAGFDGNHFITMGINNDSMALELGMDKQLFTKTFKNIARKSKLMHLKQVLVFRKAKKKKEIVLFIKYANY